MSYLNGIDISHHQGNIDLSKVPFDFCIMKASEGVSYKDNKMPIYYDAVKAKGKIKGLYHFANGRSTGEKEALFFLSAIGDRYKDSILVLDWEASAVKKGVSYAKTFLDTVRKKTGVTPYIYMSASVTREYDWSSVAVIYPLWVAQYPNSLPTGYNQNPWKDKRGLGAWTHESIRQYTSTGRLSGYNKNLDLDIMYDTPNIAKKASKTVKQVAKEVLSGLWGNGTDRRARLIRAGYNYDEVQAQVNKLLKKKS